MTDTANSSNDSGPRSGSPRARRSSFAGETFANIFGGARRNSVARPSEPAQAPAYEGPITSAARRLSISTFGNLSSSPGNGNGAQRRESSVGSPTNGAGGGVSTSNSLNESAIDEDEAAPADTQTPFVRRMSSNARALWEGRAGANAAANGSNGIGGSPKEGFNWSDNFRTRAERASSIAAAGNTVPAPLSGAGNSGHARNRSIAAAEPAKGLSGALPQEIPAKQRERPRPDHFQERILKGDFYMD